MRARTKLRLNTNLPLINGDRAVPEACSNSLFQGPHLFRPVLLLAALLCGLTQSPLTAQTYPFTTYSVEDGLAQSVVRDIFEDSRGFLWLATAGGGLSQWDGANFGTISTADGLPSDRVNSTLEGSQGRLWIATERGLAHYDGSEVTAISTTESLNILDLQEDLERVLWMATDRGVYSLSLSDLSEAQRFQDGRSGDELPKPELRSPPEIQQVASIAMNREGELWFGSKAGLLRLDDGVIRLDSTVGGPKDRTVTSLFQDRRGSLWVGFDRGGVALFDGREFSYLGPDQGLPDSPIRDFAEDGQGRLWIGTESQGIAIWSSDGMKLLQQENGLPGRGIIALGANAQGDVWLSTFGNGFSRLTTEAFVLFTTADGLPGDKIMSITQDRDGTHWIGILEGGLVRLDEEGFETLGPDQGLASPLVTSVIKDRRGGLWVTTFDAGVSFFDGNEFRNFSTEDGLALNRVFSAFQDSRDNLWFSTFGGGVSRFDGNNFQTFDTSDGLAGNRVYTTFEDRQGNLWFATSDGGVSRFDGERFENFTESTGLASHRVYAVRQDLEDRIWMATDRGLCRLEGDHLSHYGIAQGLGSVIQYFLHFDAKGALWAGGEKGLDRIELDSLGNFQNIRHFGPRDGFLGAEGNQNAIFEDQEGQMWFGAKGLVRYAPSGDKLPSRPPKLFLSYLRLGFRDVDWGERATGLTPWFRMPQGLELLHKENHLSFDFVATTTGHPATYQYRLVGLDEDWSPVSELGRATFSNIPPGRFRFEARASYDGDTWSPPASLRFTIRPPFWRTGWFALLATIASALLLWIAMKSRTALLEQRQRQLEEEVSLRTQQLQLAKEAAEMATVTKSQFLANMTHELRTPLAGMIGMTHLLEKTDLSAQQNDYASRIRTSGAALLTMINDLLEASRTNSEEGELQEQPILVQDLLLDVCGANAVEAARKGLEVTHEIASDVPPCIQSDEIRLRQILGHLVNNAVKFTDQGSVRVSVTTTPTQQGGLHLEITVSDSGIGIPKDKIYQVFDPFFQADSTLSRRYGGTGLGLSICAHLAKQMGGSIRAESTPGEGSAFTFAFPTSPGEADSP